MNPLVVVAVAAGVVALAFGGRVPESFRDALPPTVARWAELLWAAAQRYGHDPFILAAIMEVESGGGRYLIPPTPAGTGDGGHGRGLMQIDDRHHPQWLAAHDWTDPATNIGRGAWVLEYGAPHEGEPGGYSRFRELGQTGHTLDVLAVSSYNATPSRVWSAYLRAGAGGAAGVTTNLYPFRVLGQADAWRTKAGGA